MLPVFLSLFFLSTVGIIMLITKKLLQIEKLRAVSEQDVFYINVPDLEDVHHVLARKLRKGSYIALVITIRSYLLSMRALKRGLKNGMVKAEALLFKYRPKKETQLVKKEASKFLKIVSDYKKRVNEITREIKEEEGFEI